MDQPQRAKSRPFRAKPRGKYVKADAEVHDLIDEFLDRGRGAAQIFHALEAKYEQQPYRVPRLRTIQAYVTSRPSTFAGEAWQLQAVDPVAADAPFLLAALAEVIGRSEGRVKSIPAAEARWLAAIRPVATGMRPWLAYRLARLYVRREFAGRPTWDLDAWLAHRPWRSERAFETYRSIADDLSLDMPFASMSLEELSEAVSGEELYEAPSEEPDAVAEAARSQLMEMVLRLVSDPNFRQRYGLDIDAQKSDEGR
jgi:hypothetical protein